ncbi:hypothetical protein ABZ372_49220, partial [Streptomyces sp. NPDC005921]
MSFFCRAEYTGSPTIVPRVPGSKVPRAATTSMSVQVAAVAVEVEREAGPAPPTSESAARHKRIRMGILCGSGA